MKQRQNLLAATLVGAMGAFAPPAGVQEVLPFLPKQSSSIPGRSIEVSVYRPLPVVSRLPKGAPNVIIFLVDDADLDFT